MNDDQFRQILNLLELSWQGYRKVRKGVKKRLVSQMRELSIKEFDNYLTLLQQDGAAREACLRLLPVTISRFFRDRALWQALERHVLPEILARRRECVKVWSAGCARGEEVYSFRMLWEEQTARLAAAPPLLVWATDINPDNLRNAQTGVYSRSSLKEVTSARHSLYFRKTSGQNLFRVVDSLRDGIHWTVLNHLSEIPPDHGFMMIFLRHSLLTYYQDSLRQPAFERMLGSLAEDGYLIVGTREQPPREYPELARTEWHPHLYRRITA